MSVHSSAKRIQTHLVMLGKLCHASAVVWSSNSPAFIQMQIGKQESPAEHRGQQPSASHCCCLLLAAEQALVMQRWLGERIHVRPQDTGAHFPEIMC